MNHHCSRKTNGFTARLCTRNALLMILLSEYVENKKGDARDHGINVNVTANKGLSLAYWVECSPMVQETWVQSQVVSYQTL